MTKKKYQDFPSPVEEKSLSQEINTSLMLRTGLNKPISSKLGDQDVHTVLMNMLKNMKVEKR